MATRPLVALLHVPLLGCAATGGAEPFDPLEPVNRAGFALHGAIDQVVLTPATFLYRHLVPPPVRTGVSNAVSNLASVDTVLNQLLQGKWRGGGRDAARFAVNTTAGVGGLLDVATDLGLEAHEEDLGQTLGAWGAGPGPYLFVPLLGPCTLRDLAGVPVSLATHPVIWTGDEEAIRAGVGVWLVERRAGVAPAALEEVRASADPYAFVRQGYLQRRRFLVQDGAVETEEYEDELDAMLEELEGLEGLEER